jgi:hypothetical protein
MSLDVAYSYCTKLTEQEKLDIDKQVRKNRLELIIGIFFPFAAVPTIPMQITWFTSGPSQIERNVKNQVESATAKKMAPKTECEEASNKYKVELKMSPTLSKVSKRLRKNQKTKKALDNLQEQLKNAEFHAGRGAQKLAGTKTVFYLRSGGVARVFFMYSEKERGVVEVIAESDKEEEQAVIKNIKQNYG